ncbi:MAG: DUF916 domain-containing protein [Candidatus Roizmanbacteria bacterium]|nr:DUF916 domain-containing protein [Candidatus Roizmanbacteria bacterium]
MLWFRFLISSICCSFLLVALPALAAGDALYLAPAKQEFVMNPGEQRSVVVTVENRSSTTLSLSVDVEDVGAGADSKTAVVPLGERIPGEYSLAAYTLLSETSLVLPPGVQRTVEAQIALPPTVTPGGHYGALMFSTYPQATTGTTRVVTRIGGLLFVRVAGDVREEGLLMRFGTRSGKKVSFSTELPLVLEYKNIGNVHLNPYGVVTLTPWWGRSERTFAVDPWYVLPGGARSRDIFLPRIVIPGRYLLTLQLNRGYGDILDTQTISVWILPWQWIVGAVLLFMLLGLWQYFVRMSLL